MRRRSVKRERRAGTYAAIANAFVKARTDLITERFIGQQLQDHIVRFSDLQAAKQYPEAALTKTLADFESRLVASRVKAVKLEIALAKAEESLFFGHAKLLDSQGV